MFKIILTLCFLSLSYLSSLFAQENPYNIFNNKIAVNGSDIYQVRNNGDIEYIKFSDYSWTENYEIIYNFLDKPQTNILYFDKINPYNKEEMHYYSIYTNEENSIETNYIVFMLKNDVLIIGDINPYSGEEVDETDPYDYNMEIPVAMLIDKDKYGNQYLKELISKDLNKYRARYFEGKYVSEDGKSYFTLYRTSGNNFSFEGSIGYTSVNVSGYDEVVYCKLFPANNQIVVEDNSGGDFIVYQLNMNIFDNETLLVFEGFNSDYGFHGVYKKVKE